MNALTSLALPALIAATLCAQTPAPAPPAAPPDTQVLANAQAQSSQACTDYTPELGGPGLAAVPVAALRVIAKYEIVLCPDSHLTGDTAIVWYPTLGAFTWKPGDPAILKTLAEIVDRLARLDDFHQNLTVWDASMKN